MSRLTRPHCLVLSALLLFLAGCGQTGPLYLPGNPSQMTTVAPETAAEDEGDETANSQSDDR